MNNIGAVARAIVILIARLALLPGKLMARHFDRKRAQNGLAPLNSFQRGAVHAFVGVAALTAMSMGPAATSTSSTSASAYVPTYAPTRSTPSSTPISVDADVAAAPGLTVARIVDGDTLELSDGSTIRPLGIDSCETDTPGGANATASAGAWQGEEVTLTAEPGVDTDRYGRLLRYVHSDELGDFGEYQVRYDHTGVYQGRNDASQAYLKQLYVKDTLYSTNPPSGRECGEFPPPAPVDESPAYVPNNDDDDGMRDGALTGGYCARKWWC